MRAAAQLGCAFAVLGAATAFAADPVVRQGNLDSDAKKEDVRAEDVQSADPPDHPVFQVRISDSCPEGPVTAVVSGRHDGAVGQLRLVSADTHRGKEILFALSDFGRGDGEIGLVAWREFADAPCRRPRSLFRYSPGRAGPPPPRGAYGEAVAARVRLRNYASRFDGKEIRLAEAFRDKNDDLASPSIARRTFYRYHQRKDKYVAYRSVVRDRETRRVVCARARAAC